MSGVRFSERALLSLAAGEELELLAGKLETELVSVANLAYKQPPHVVSAEKNLLAS